MQGGGAVIVDKSKLTFIVDALMFLLLMAIVGIGLLIKYVLVTGKERWATYGGNVDLYLLGMDRHGWGTVHFVIGLIFLGLLVFHIVLHWRAILVLFRRLIGSRKKRVLVAALFAIICAFLVVFPFVVNPEAREIGRGEGRDEARRGYVEEIETNGYPEASVEVRGYMTLLGVAEEYGVPVEYLKESLGIPQGAPSEQQLGWLQKKYGFRMSDVERIIDEYHKSH